MMMALSALLFVGNSRLEAGNRVHFVSKRCSVSTGLGRRRACQLHSRAVDERKCDCGHARETAGGRVGVGSTPISPP
jgi:hypothetical protein